MGATTLVRQADGSERQGPLMLVTRGNAIARSDFRNAGVATIVSSNGGGANLLTMFNIETTANYNVFARRPVQTAAVGQLPSPPGRN